MTSIIRKFFKFLFFLVCSFFTIGLSIYSIHRYYLDEDTTLVEITKFLSSKDAIYPSFSFCILPPFLDEKFNAYRDDKINSSSYKRFLLGEFWDERFLKIEYDNVTISLTENLIEAYYKTNSGKLGNWTPEHFVSFRGAKRKCFTINTPFIDNELLFHTNMKIKNSIFPEGKRSSVKKTIKTYVHYPGQRFTSYFSSFHDFPSRQNKSESYLMKYRVRFIGASTQRNRYHKPCAEDWRNYDNLFMKNLMNKVGCRPPHWQSELVLPICSNHTEMEVFSEQPNRHDLESFIQPCKVIDQIELRYDEYEIDNNEYGLNEET